MTEVYLFTELPEQLGRDSSGAIVGIGPEGVEQAVDLSCHVRSIRIDGPPGMEEA